jgi:Na+-driven multidrug efflux pump
MAVDVQDVDPQTAITVAAIRSAQDAVPSWCSGLIGCLSCAVALGYIAVAILLAVPAAKAYFGRVIEPWQQLPDEVPRAADRQAPYAQE